MPTPLVTSQDSCEGIALVFQTVFVDLADIVLTAVLHYSGKTISAKIPISLRTISSITTNSPTQRLMMAGFAVP